MNHTFKIISAPEDFYISDALCRALKANDLDSNNVVIAVISQSLLNNKSLCDSVTSEMANPDSQHILLLSESGLSLKQDWQKSVSIDASTGLTHTIITKILELASTPKSSPTISEATNIDEPAIPEQQVNLKHRLSEETFNKRYKTISSAYPKSTMEDYSDDAKEAWSVPVFILPFERGEQLPDKGVLLATIDSSLSIALQKSLRYVAGDGVPLNNERAFSLLQDALNNDETDAMLNYAMGIFNECGIGCNHSKEKAMEYYNIASNAGLELAKLRLHLMKYFITGKSPELKTILEENYKNNNLDATFMLGVLAEDDERFSEAFNLYSEAAEAGHAGAQNALAYMNYNGIGIAKNKAQALEWLSLSEKQGFPMAIWNRQMETMNQMDKATPIYDNFQSFNKRKDIFIPIYQMMDSNDTFVKIFNYNYGILSRRCAAPIERTRSWLKHAECEYTAEYIAKFYENFEKENSRRKFYKKMDAASDTVVSVLRFFGANI